MSVRLVDLPSATGAFWLTTYETGIAVDVARGNVMRAAPSARWSVGKPVTALMSWLTKQGGLKAERLHKSALDPPPMPTVVNSDGVL